MLFRWHQRWHQIINNAKFSRLKFPWEYRFQTWIFMRIKFLENLPFDSGIFIGHYMSLNIISFRWGHKYSSAYIIASFFAGEVKTLLLQLLKAVAHMHDNWILHRDLKTSNLLLSHKGILKVGLIPYIERKYSWYWIRHDYIWIIFLCIGNSQ